MYDLLLYYVSAKVLFPVVVKLMATISFQKAMHPLCQPHICLLPKRPQGALLVPLIDHRVRKHPVPLRGHRRRQKLKLLPPHHPPPNHQTPNQRRHTESVASGPVSTENAAPSTPEGSNSSSDFPPSNSDDSTSSSGSPAYSGDTNDNAEMTGNDASNYPASQVHKSSSAGDKIATPAFHYGLFAAIFAIVALILVVVVGILKEHRFLRFRVRRVGTTQASSEGKTSRETLHSLLGPSKLGFSRLRTYDSDSEVEEFPIFSRVRFCLLSSVY